MQGSRPPAGSLGRRREEREGSFGRERFARAQNPPGGAFAIDCGAHGEPGVGVSEGGVGASAERDSLLHEALAAVEPREVYGVNICRVGLAAFGDEIRLGDDA